MKSPIKIILIESAFVAALLSMCTPSKKMEWQNATFKKGICICDTLLNDSPIKCSKYVVSILDTFKVNTVVKTNNTEFVLRHSIQKRVLNDSVQINFERYQGKEAITITDQLGANYYTGLIEDSSNSSKGLSKTIKLERKENYIIKFEDGCSFVLRIKNFNNCRIVKIGRELIVVYTNEFISYQ